VLASDQSYQLWLFDSEHPAGISLAVFAVDSDSNDVCISFKLDRPGATGAGFKISRELKGGASVPEGPVVLASH
jgi:anti-sigma-K factor RskA